MPSIQQLTNPKSLFSGKSSKESKQQTVPVASKAGTQQPQPHSKSSGQTDSLKESSASSMASSSSLKSAASSINEEIKQKFQTKSIFKNSNQNNGKYKYFFSVQFCQLHNE
jgi:hypothetical protein